MPVGDEHAVHALPALDQPGEIRVEHVDAVIVLGEAGPAVDDDDAVLLLDGEAVHPDLAEPTERHETNAIRTERGGQELALTTPSARLVSRAVSACVSRCQRARVVLGLRPAQ